MGHGELFALSSHWVERLLHAPGTDVLDVVDGVGASITDTDRLACGKDWPEIHRCLTGGKAATSGPPPLYQCFLGSRQLADPNGGCIVSLLLATEVPDLSAARDSLDVRWLHIRCNDLFGPECPQGLPAEWLHRICTLFVAVQTFYRVAGETGSAVLFTTDESLNAIYPADST